MAVARKRPLDLSPPDAAAPPPPASANQSLESLASPQSESPVKKPRHASMENGERKNTEAAENKMPISGASESEESRGAAPAATAAAGKKKMVIKPFKVNPRPPAEFEEATMQTLLAAVRAVHNKQAVPQSQEELYRGVESLCIHKKSETLYTRLCALCDEAVALMVSSLAAQPDEPFAFLKGVESAWVDYTSQMLTIRSIFLYLDRTYVIQNTRDRSIWDFGLALFSKHVQSAASLLRRIVRGILGVIEQERRGESVNVAQLKTLVRMLSALRLYSSPFEKEFLDATSAFYTEEAGRLINEMAVADYLTYASEALARENARVSAYLEESTRGPLVRTIEQPLIASHVATLVSKGLDALLDNDRSADLQRMYSLLQRVRGLEPMRVAFAEYVTRTGNAIVQRQGADAEMVPDLLALKERLERLLRSAFADNADFRSAMRASFEAFINARDNRPAALIARYVDQLLRPGNRAMTAQELEQQLSHALALFKFILAKDVFEAFYKKDLAKRLLLGKSASQDAELFMIRRLEEECGSTFTSKLQSMIDDMETSRRVLAEFKGRQRLERQPDGGDAARVPIDFTVQVLTQGCWPEYKAVELSLPPEVTALEDSFKQFYLNSHNNRKLTWLYAWAKCELRARFPAREHILCVSAFQAAVLLLFNSHQKLTAEEIRQMTKLEEEEVIRTLQSLAQMGESTVLLQEPRRQRQIKPSDVFTVNDKFRSKLTRITINAVQIRETATEAKATEERVAEERQYALDACIVRIMKARKRMSHAELVSEVMQQSKFPTSNLDIKKRIQGLIERDYLERDKDEKDHYKYLA